MKRQENFQRIQEEFRGIKSTSCIKSGRKKTLIPKVKSDEGETITSRNGIANVSSHSKLYAEDQLGEEVQDPHNSEMRMSTGRESRIDNVKNEIPEFTQDEVQTAIDKLKKGKARDKQRIRTESDKARGLHTRNLEKKNIKVIYRKRECGRCR